MRGLNVPPQRMTEHNVDKQSGSICLGGVLVNSTYGTPENLFSSLLLLEIAFLRFNVVPRNAVGIQRMMLYSTNGIRTMRRSKRVNCPIRSETGLSSSVTAVVARVSMEALSFRF